MEEFEKIKNFIEDEIVQNCIKEYKKILIEKEKVKYNLFTLSSYNNQLENFHSDVIASLLDPKGLHGEGNKFLMMFIKYLNEKHGYLIDFNDFSDASVHKEIGSTESHIDILISGQKKAIIIENKINDAPDMEEQLDRYYTLVEERWHKEVCCCIYLTLDGRKQPPGDIVLAAPYLKAISAFENKDSDLCNGWLAKFCEPSIEPNTNDDSRSLIFQYIKLLKHLANNSMDTSNFSQFYNYISNTKSLDLIKTIIKLTGSIPSHRAEFFIKSIKDFKPFNKLSLYYPNYPNLCLFYNFYEEDNSFKLDVGFHDDGSVKVCFWNISKDNEDGRIIVFNKIQSIGFENDLLFVNHSKHEKTFSLEDCGSLLNIDKEVLLFVELFLMQLRLKSA